MPKQLRVHLLFAALFMLLVLGLRWVDDPSMIGLILKIAAYLYGALLGLFAFGIFTRREVRDAAVPWVASWGTCAAPEAVAAQAIRPSRPR